MTGRCDLLIRGGDVADGSGGPVSGFDDRDRAVRRDNQVAIRMETPRNDLISAEVSPLGRELIGPCPATRPKRA